MGSGSQKFGAPEWLILVGAIGFILVLGISAYWEPDIRVLHFFQAWMYIAAVPAWFSNLLVICGCLWAYSRLDKRRLSDIWRFVAVFVLTTGFFALDMALFQPRYLAIFPRLFHPHLP
jgi:hypothetical protein